MPSTVHDRIATGFNLPQVCPHTTWTRSPRWVLPHPAREPTKSTVASDTCRRKSSTCVASPQVEKKKCGSQVASPNVPSKRGVTCSRGVKGPGGVARCGVKTWQSPDVNQKCASLACVAAKSQVASLELYQVHANGLTWRHKTCRQIVASASEREIRRHAPTRGVTGRRVNTWRQGPSLPALVFKMCLQSSGDVHGHKRPL